MSTTPRPAATRAVSHVPLPKPPTARAMASKVPLPPYAQLTQAQGSAGSKLMSLNSTIMAAQREWEQKNQAGDQSSGASSYSESGASTISDDEPSKQPSEAEQPPSRLNGVPNASLGHQMDSAFYQCSDKRPVVSAKGSSGGPTAGEKRSLGAASLEDSSRPAKRPDFMASRTSSESSSSSFKAGQSHSYVPRHAQKGIKHSRASKRDWLVFNAYDAISTRADGMQYDYYHAENDWIGTMSGALVPTNYRLDRSSSCPFVCPDRECNKSFESARALGGHFSSGHKGTAYNDNCDGTFSKVGFYPKIIGERLRAIVVSRVSVNGSEEEDAIVENPPALFTAADVAVTSPDPFTYVSGFLPRHLDHTIFLRTAYIRALCELPKRRQLPASWIDFHRNTDFGERMFALAVAYITGAEVFGLHACDGGLHETGSRLSLRSIAVPFGLSNAHMKTHFPDESCVGCYYSAEIRGRGTQCSWMARKEPFLYRYERRIDGLDDGDYDDGAFSHPGTANDVAEQRRQARAVDSAIKAGKAARFSMPSLNSVSHVSQSAPSEEDLARNSRLAADSISQNVSLEHQQYEERSSATGVYSVGRERAKIAAQAAFDDWSRSASVAPMAEREEPPVSKRISRSAAAARNLEPAISPEPLTQPRHSVQAPRPQLQMESWEVAPGRMIDGTHGENIGYSNAYLNGREPVDVSQDVAFNVITVKPGDKARWEAHESQLRTCSVASGKIEIKLGANKFGMGPNSVFIIRPGETCVVTNRLYIDATVHCTTVKNYSRLS